MDENPIMDMGQASNAVAKFQPTEVELSDGSKIKVGKISWLAFEEIWEEAAGIVASVFAGDTTKRRGMDLVSILAVITEDLKKAPRAMRKIVDHTTSVKVEVYEQWQFLDMVRVVAAAIRVNIIDMRGLEDFSGVVSGAFLGDGSESSEETIPTPASE